MACVIRPYGRNLRGDIDPGLQAGFIDIWEAFTQFSGIHLGSNVQVNMWVSMGYNVLGMDDRDFSDASYRAKGPYITLRMKEDQDTFGLNKGGATTRPLTSE